MSDEAAVHRVSTFRREFPDVATDVNDFLCTLAYSDAHVVCNDLDGRFSAKVETTRFHVAVTPSGAHQYDLASIADTCMAVMSKNLKLRQVHALFMDDLVQLSFFIKNLPMLDDDNPPVFSEDLCFYKPTSLKDKHAQLVRCIEARQQRPRQTTFQRICQINDVPTELLRVRARLLWAVLFPFVQRAALDDPDFMTLEMRGGPYNMLVLVKVSLTNAGDGVPDFKRWSAHDSKLAQLFLDENNDVLSKKALHTSATDVAVFCGPAPAPIFWHSCLHDKSVVFSVQPEKIVTLANIGTLTDMVVLVDALSHCLRLCPAPVAAAPCSANMVVLHDGRLHLDFCVAGHMEPTSYTKTKDVFPLAMPVQVRDLYDIVVSKKRVISQVALRFQANDHVRAAAVFCLLRLLMTKMQCPLRFKSAQLKLDWIVHVDWTDTDEKAYADTLPLLCQNSTKRGWSCLSSPLYSTLAQKAPKHAGKT